MFDGLIWRIWHNLGTEFRDGQPAAAKCCNDVVSAHGIGAYIAKATVDGDYPRIVLGVAVMSIFVIMFNRLLWRPLYRLAEKRLRLD